MASITRERDVLTRELLQGPGVLSEQLSAAEVEASCKAVGHVWRDRSWGPFRTVWTFLLQVLHAGSSCRSAAQHGKDLHRLSFAGTVDRLNALAPYLWLLAGTSKADALLDLLLHWIAHDPVPHRPNRIEPRAVKRRPKQYDQ